MTRLLLALALALGLIAPSTAAVPVASATISLSSYRYNPGPIYLPGGVPVRLILVNRAGKTHDFTAEQFFRTARVLRGGTRGGQVVLRAGQSQVIDLIPARGTYKVHCGQFGHRMFGMSTMIIVG